MKGKFRRYGRLCWPHKIEHNVAGACTHFEICTATSKPNAPHQRARAMYWGKVKRLASGGFGREL